MGQIYLQWEEYDKALDNLNQAVATQPENADYINKRGEVSLAMKSKQEAMADFNQAILIEPNLALAYINRAALKYEMEDYSGAVEDQSKALNIVGNDLKALEQLTVYNNALEEAFDSGVSTSEPIEMITAEEIEKEEIEEFMEVYTSKGESNNSWEKREEVFTSKGGFIEKEEQEEYLWDEAQNVQAVFTSVVQVLSLIHI